MCCKLTQCCCCSCCTLQTGTKIIGFLCLIGEIYGLINQAIGIHANEYWAGSTPHVVAITVVNLVLIIIGIIFTILLLIAAFRNDKPMFLVPWLILSMLSILYTTAILLFYGIIAIAAGAVMQAIIYFCVVILILALPIYFWIVVHSYLHELKNNTGRSNDIKM